MQRKQDFESSDKSNTQMNEAHRKDSHRILITGFDGHNEVVEADEIRFCVPTAECIKFWATVVACFLAVAIGVFFMIYQGSGSPYFPIGSGLLALAIGVLIPSPNYDAMIVRPRSRCRQDSASPEPILHDERKDHDQSGAPLEQIAVQ